MRLGADSQFSDFLDGLGPGQLVGRQTLATPAMGKQWRHSVLFLSVHVIIEEQSQCVLVFFFLCALCNAYRLLCELEKKI